MKFHWLLAGMMLATGANAEVRTTAPADKPELRAEPIQDVATADRQITQIKQQLGELQQQQAQQQAELDRLNTCIATLKTQLADLKAWQDNPKRVTADKPKIQGSRCD